MVMQGNKKERLTGEQHMEVMEEFCTAVHEKWPHCLVQFEDFPTDRAFAILERFRHRLLCFNDDIQVFSWALLISKTMSFSHCSFHQDAR